MARSFRPSWNSKQSQSRWHVKRNGPHQAPAPRRMSSVRHRSVPSRTTPGPHPTRQAPAGLNSQRCSRLFSEALNGAKYMVTFLCDFDKRSHATLLRVKSGVLQAFKNYKKQNEYGDKRIKRLRSDCGGEYDSEDFENFRNEHGYRTGKSTYERDSRAPRSNASQVSQHHARRR